MSSKPLIRALHGAAKVHSARAPHDTIHFRLHYPAEYTGTDEERLSGVLPARREQSPWPLAIILPGVNVGADQYRWLATSLVSGGIATITFDFVDEIMPGKLALSPGVDITAVAPNIYGTRPSATAIAPILGALHRLEREGPINGLIDASRFILIGHSTGGAVALQNAKREWFPGLRGVVAYGAHTVPALMIGHPFDTILPVLDDIPVLLLSGSRDGVMRQSADRYTHETDHDPVGATFEHGISSHLLSRLAVIEGATHMVMAHPGDPTTSRGFLDDEPTVQSTAEAEEIRELISRLTIVFAHAALAKDQRHVDTKALESFSKNPRIVEWIRK